MQQAFNKSNKDYDEIKSEKEDRTAILNKLKDTNTTHLNLLNSDIATLNDKIFKSEEYLDKQKKCEECIIEKEILIKDE